MNGEALVKVEPLQRKNATTGLTEYVKDKSSGLQTVILVPKAGKIPYQRTLSGALAQRLGLIEGSMYHVDWTEQAPSAEYGRQFNFDNLGEVSGYKAIREIKDDLGEPIILGTGKGAVVSTNTFIAGAPITEAVGQTTPVNTVPGAGVLEEQPVQ